MPTLQVHGVFEGYLVRFLAAISTQITQMRLIGTDLLKTLAA